MDTSGQATPSATEPAPVPCGKDGVVLSDLPEADQERFLAMMAEGDRMCKERINRMVAEGKEIWPGPDAPICAANQVDCS